MNKTVSYEQLQQKVTHLKEEVEKYREMEGELHAFKAIAAGMGDDPYVSFAQNFKGVTYKGDLNFTPATLTGAVKEITGYAADEFLAARPRWDEIIHPEDLPKVADTADSLRAVPEFSVEREYRIICKNGEIRWVREFIKNFCDPSGRPESVQGILYDITDRKQIEKALVHSKKEWEQTFDAISDWVCLVDLDGRILRTNAAAERFIGLTPREAAGRQCCPMLFGSPGPAEDCPLRKMTETGRRESSETELPDGRQITITVDPVRNGYGEIVSAVHIVHDVTARKTLENRLRQAHKQEAIGTLTGGIAHEFNNILGVIIGNAELALDDLPEQSPARKNLAEIQTAGFRARDIIRQLLSITRMGGLKPHPLHVGDIVLESMKFLRPIVPTAIEVRTVVQEDCDTVMGDPTQIYQILINLCTNALQAMEETGGALDVRVENVRVHEKNPAGDIAPGRYVALKVTDSGEGIPPEVMNRIFDPYFTIRPPGMGAGMGLTVVHGLTTNHGGKIHVTSAPGAGTTFTVFLPAAD